MTLPSLQLGRGQHVRKEGIAKMTNVTGFQVNLNAREIQLHINNISSDIWHSFYH